MCNSADDLPGAVDRGDCRLASTGSGVIDYPEVRVLAQNWESPVVTSWVMQIFMSEVLGVPTTLETGIVDDGTASIDFYHPSARYDLGVAYDWDAFRRANRYGNCNNVPKGPDGKRQTCAQFIPEVWGRTNQLRDLAEEAVIESAQAIGSIGEEYWYIPKFTAIRDPTLTSYIGLAGEKNRQKLAETFLTPTTWQEYCVEVSTNGCTQDDGVAKRAPQDDAENDRMFVDGLYTGHFRSTFQNNCTINPNCTGHFADYPCGWGSYSRAQAFHNNIALEPGGGKDLYSYSQLIEMWSAANATESNLVRSSGT